MGGSVGAITGGGLGGVLSGPVGSVLGAGAGAGGSGALGGTLSDTLGGAVGLGADATIKPIIGAAADIAKTSLPEAFKARERAIKESAFQIPGTAGALARSQGLADTAIKREGALEHERAKLLGRADQSRAQQQRAGAGEQALRGEQLGFIQSLQQQAAGKGPSLATAQLKAAQDRSLKQQLAAAASQRGGNQAALQRSLARGQASQAAEIAQQSAQARMQEQLQAQQLLGGALQQARGQDQSTVQNLLSAEQQQFQAANQALQGGLGFAQQQLSADNLASQIQQQKQQAAADLEKAKIQQSLAVQGLNAESTAAQQAAISQLIGGIVGGASSGAGAAISDKNSKTNMKSYSSKDMKNSKSKSPDKLGKALGKTGSSIKAGFDNAAKEASKGSSRARGTFEQELSKLSDKNTKQTNDDFDPRNFLDALKAHSFEYKDEFKNLPGAGEGKFLGVMAQDLEKAGKVGKSMVNQDASGNKMVDFGKGFGAILASQTHLNERLKELESKKKKR